MESLRVAVRIRPEQIGDSCIINDNSKLTIIKSSKDSSSAESTFTLEFDRVFGTDSSQADIFEFVRPLVDECLKGFTVTIFAFGMTGSGKSHTISGKHGSSDSGIVPRAVNYIFDNLTKTTTMNCDQVSMVCLTYVELYNNQLNDLLSENVGEATHLKVHEHPKRGIYLTGSPGIRTPVSTPQEAMELIEKGNLLRATSATNLNDRSSRSHTVITLEIISRALSSTSTDTIDENATISIGKINLVDLAGSERVKLSGASGQTLEEAKQINKALSVLGDVLNSLGKYHQSMMAADSRSSIVPPHVPYRNSKLTMLLKDSLGGNSKTMMITTIRMSKVFYQQTAMALKYAARAKHIRNIPTQNTGYDENDSNGHGATFMKKTLDEVARLKEQLFIRQQEFDNLKDKLSALKKDDAIHGSNELKTELESKFRFEIEALTKQNVESKKQLQEHMGLLLHNHNSVLAQKIAESEALETKIKQHASTIESLFREKKVASLNQHKANATVQELYKKISEGQADSSRLEKEKNKLEVDLKQAVAKSELESIEKNKFIDAIKKLMDSRQRHKSRLRELEAELLRSSDLLRSKDDEIEANKQNYAEARQSSENNYANLMSILKRSEQQIATLAEENLAYKTEIALSKNCSSQPSTVQQKKFIEQSEEAEAVVAINEGKPSNLVLELTLTNVSDQLAQPMAKAVLENKLISPTADSTGFDIIKRDRIQVENVALRQKVKLMVEEEKYLIQQLQDKTVELSNVKSQMMALRHDWSSEVSQISSYRLNDESEIDELKNRVVAAERKAIKLDSELEMAKRRNRELNLLLERKNGVLSLEQGLSRTFKESLERTRSERGDELKKAFVLVKAHLDGGLESVSSAKSELVQNDNKLVGSSFMLGFPLSDDVIFESDEDNNHEGVDDDDDDDDYDDEQDTEKENGNGNEKEKGEMEKDEETRSTTLEAV